MSTFTMYPDGHLVNGVNVSRVHMAVAVHVSDSAPLKDRRLVLQESLQIRCGLAREPALSGLLVAGEPPA